MKKIKKVLRIIALVCLLALASVGVGIGGGIPPSWIKNKRETETEYRETMEQKDKEDIKQGVK